MIKFQTYEKSVLLKFNLKWAGPPNYNKLLTVPLILTILRIINFNHPFISENPQLTEAISYFQPMSYQVSVNPEESPTLLDP